ncbi:hypothetical protein Pelo_15876 [Pelomyxa schiedti]|nr:hypothetical protein Pelo_15876 [Pelomyxa schiedti]
MPTKTVKLLFRTVASKYRIRRKLSAEGTVLRRKTNGQNFNKQLKPTMCRRSIRSSVSSDESSSSSGGDFRQFRQTMAHFPPVGVVVVDPTTGYSSRPGVFPPQHPPAWLVHNRKARWQPALVPTIAPQVTPTSPQAVPFPFSPSHALLIPSLPYFQSQMPLAPYTVQPSAIQNYSQTLPPRVKTLTGKRRTKGSLGLKEINNGPDENKAEGSTSGMPPPKMGKTSNGDSQSSRIGCVHSESGTSHTSHPKTEATDVTPRRIKPQNESPQSKGPMAPQCQSLLPLGSGCSTTQQSSEKRRANLDRNNSKRSNVPLQFPPGSISPTFHSHPFCKNRTHGRSRSRSRDRRRSRSRDRRSRSRDRRRSRSRSRDRRRSRSRSIRHNREKSGGNIQVHERQTGRSSGALQSNHKRESRSPSGGCKRDLFCETKGAPHIAPSTVGHSGADTLQTANMREEKRDVASSVSVLQSAAETAQGTAKSQALTQFGAPSPNLPLGKTRCPSSSPVVPSVPVVTLSTGVVPSEYNKSLVPVTSSITMSLCSSSDLSQDHSGDSNNSVRALQPTAGPPKISPPEEIDAEHLTMPQEVIHSIEAASEFKTTPIAHCVDADPLPLVTNLGGHSNAGGTESTPDGTMQLVDEQGCVLSQVRSTSQNQVPVYTCSPGNFSNQMIHLIKMLTEFLYPQEGTIVQRKEEFLSHLIAFLETASLSAWKQQDFSHQFVFYLSCQLLKGRYLTERYTLLCCETNAILKALSAKPIKKKKAPHKASASSPDQQRPVMEGPGSISSDLDLSESILPPLEPNGTEATLFQSDMLPQTPTVQQPQAHSGTQQPLIALPPALMPPSPLPVPYISQAQHFQNDVPPGLHNKKQRQAARRKLHRKQDKLCIWMGMQLKYMEALVLQAPPGIPVPLPNCHFPRCCFVVDDKMHMSVLLQWTICCMETLDCDPQVDTPARQSPQCS